jgi:hypothetical protein
MAQHSEMTEMKSEKDSKGFQVRRKMVSHGTRAQADLLKIVFR